MEGRPHLVVGAALDRDRPVGRRRRLLALFTLSALRASSRAAMLRLAGLALVWVLAIAACDEARQSFSATRTGSAWDVGLDVSGGVLALALAIAYTRVMQLRRAAPERR
jgi:VanZ family protein